MEKSQNDIELEKITLEIKDWTKKIDSLESEEEKAKYLKDHWDYFMKMQNESDELFQKSLDEMNEYYLKFFDEHKNTITKYDDEFDKKFLDMQEDYRIRKENIDKLISDIDTKLEALEKENKGNG